MLSELPGWHCCHPSLFLNANALRAAGAALLAPALATTTRLTELDLGGNALGDLGAASLAPALATISQLSSLDLNNNAIGSRVSDLQERHCWGRRLQV
jgi:Ran GTPase-activating protein (RanGAP) involved in mRNA processing and transport